MEFDHEEIVIRRGRRSGLFTIVAVHSTALGPSLGGCRMWSYTDAVAALRDALRLSEGMTYKAAVAGLPQGGGKGVIVVEPGQRLAGEARRAALLDFAETVNAVDGRYITAEDVGVSPEDILVCSEITSHVSALPLANGGSGDPSVWTALGVQVSIEVACERAFGTADLSGRSVAVIGLGHVGADLARRLHAAGAQLVVSDINAERRAVAAELGATWADPADALFAEVDVLAPCALGAAFDAETVPRLHARVVAGAANNQLSEPWVDQVLVAHDVLWVPDFVVNAGGIVNIASEFDGGYDPVRAEHDVRAIGDTVRLILDEAAAKRITPLAAAMAIARRRVAAGDPTA
ncbi:MAG: leucine dehydrogenase [Solirubrobacteraceae bacterium]|jgi:leucine dehydrogenase|nr:leucine dehydrogenase [Solirubrobacteraceae bacterium]